MNEEELKEMCDVYKNSILKEGDTDAYLLLLVKNVERETRHRCVSLAYDLANTISNLNKGGL